MPYTCATWDWESDGYKKGPRYTPSLEGRYTVHGWLNKEEVHASLQSPLRVLIVTYLGANGPTATPTLARALGCSLDRIGPKLRGMQSGGLLHRDRQTRERGEYWGGTPRVWSATETGCWALWRQAWLTRSALCPAHLLWDAGTTFPIDPVEAVRLHVREEFLRPGSYRALAYMMRTGLATIGETAAVIGVAAATLHKRMHWWARLGWVAETRWPAHGLPGQEAWCWLITDAGISGLVHHTNALRNAAIACGWTPTPGAVEYGPGHCVYEHEREFLEMGWKL